jgi:hypothetical protein
MRTTPLSFNALAVSVLLMSSAGVQPVSTQAKEISAGQTFLYGGIGRGSLQNAGSLVLIDQTSGAGTVIGHPDAVPGVTGLAFDMAGNLYATTISGPTRNRTYQHTDPHRP